MTSNVAVRGGNIQLFGQIINTAGGGTGVHRQAGGLDGFGQIAVNNQSSLPVELKSMDTGVDPDAANPGRGTVGKINIADVQFVGAAGDQNLYAIYTEISRDHDAITVNQTGAWNADGTLLPELYDHQLRDRPGIPCRASVRAVPRTGPQPAGRPALCLHYRSGFGHRVYLALQRYPSFFGTSTLSAARQRQQDA